MSRKLLLSVDIGSTYTKGGLFALEGEELRLVGREIVPTTVDDLGRGFSRVREAVLVPPRPAAPRPRRSRSTGRPRPAAGSRSRRSG